MSEIDCKPSEHIKHNPIGFLQEFSQKHKEEPIAVYAECRPSKTGKFTCKCIFGNYEVTCSSAKKKVAKSEAAGRMIALLEEEKYFDKFKTKSRTNESEAHDPIADSLSHCVNASNAINALHFYSQKNKLKYPEYSKTSVPGGGILFMCTFNGKESYGYGNNKKSAKTKAALKMCNLMNITFNAGKNGPPEEDDFLTVEDAVTALEEICQLLNSQDSQPVYESKPTSFNSFEVICTVGGITGEGKNLTNKGAKMSAAKEVLKKLSKTDLTTTREYLRNYLSKKEAKSELRVQEEGSNIKKARLKYELEDFDMYYDDERDKINEKLAAESDIPDENTNTDLARTDEHGTDFQTDDSKSSSRFPQEDTVVSSESVHTDQENPIRDAILNWLQKEQNSSKTQFYLEDIYQTSDEECDMERKESVETNSNLAFNFPSDNEMSVENFSNYPEYNLLNTEKSNTKSDIPTENNSICDALITWMHYSKDSSEHLRDQRSPKENEVNEFKYVLENYDLTIDDDRDKDKDQPSESQNDSNSELLKTNENDGEIETKCLITHSQNLEEILAPKHNTQSLTGTMMILLYWVFSLLNWFAKRTKLKGK